MASIEEYSLVLSSIRSAGSEIDLTALVETYSTLLFRVAFSLLRSQAEAEDMVQDVFVRVLEHQRSLPEVREMRVWLVRIAWNLAIDRRRRIKPDQMDVVLAETLAATSISAEKALDEAQRMQAVLRELERLPKVERHVLLLSSLEDLNTREIATVLGKTESAVRGLLSRARTRLRERLEKGGRK
ncbi:RNA polymerase sigma factor [Edaphobacter modestus]|uniref:RNA polymerase sigma-70 factor (ECF subfamily) n=1 Tax=Edaphobacter modestus TaxID=388466 RepID=A0A4Q7YVQ1_9BACT|nr:sigma-70 family RNA polymerase sigma factor [Edaphobacter modestus]RZU41867.1 RNA polymerase sigma-70 factor (ECF subfamily) [Edaphobacter modestus]